AMRVGGNIGPYAAHQNSAAPIDFRAVELAAAVAETANGGRLGFAASIDVCLAPLARMRIVDEERGAFPMSARPVRLDLLQPGAAVPDGTSDLGAVQHLRMRAAVEGVGNLNGVRVPGAPREVEVMRAVPGARLSAREQGRAEQSARDY